MRIIVFFDLPTLTKKDRRYANRFRNFLLNDGYIMLQLSVYSRICKGLDDVWKHEKRLIPWIPNDGSVRLLTITEKQYTEMKVLAGTIKKEEEIDDRQLILLWFFYS